MCRMDHDYDKIVFRKHLDYPMGSEDINNCMVNKLLLKGSYINGSKENTSLLSFPAVCMILDCLMMTK